jgi:xanthine dehydrogenase accessory factor
VDEVRGQIARRLAQGERVALATVVATRRSAPRPPGSKLIATEAGELFGSVSGGCVESDVAVQAAEVIATGEPRLLSYGISDDEAWELGLPCGGEIDVFVQRLEHELPDGEGVLMTALDGDRVGEQELLPRGSVEPGVQEVDGAQVFAEEIAPPPRLVIVGATDTAEELCRAAGSLGWHTVVIDPRPRLATRERLPSADELLVEWPDALEADRDTAVVVLAHGQRLDDPALAKALASDAFYVGAIGSRKTQSNRRDRLLDAGLDEAAIDRISGPAGLDLGAATPAETAVSILAEIIAVRAGHDGGRLKNRSGSIHATA